LRIVLLSIRAEGPPETAAASSFHDPHSSCASDSFERWQPVIELWHEPFLLDGGARLASARVETFEGGPQAASDRPASPLDLLMTRLCASEVLATSG